MKSSMFQSWSAFLPSRKLKENFQKNLKLSQFLNRLTQHEMISKKTIVNGCLQYDIKQNSGTFLVYDLKF